MEEWTKIRQRILVEGISKRKILRETGMHWQTLERRPGALDYARSLEQWSLPGCFGALRRRLENDLAGEGTREYIRVLRLLEKYPMARLSNAIEEALQVGALKCDAIAQFLFLRDDWRAIPFTLDEHPHLRYVQVAMPDLSVLSRAPDRGPLPRRPALHRRLRRGESGYGRAGGR